MSVEIQFPDPLLADDDGLVFVGGEASVTNLVNAYKKGIFPWPIRENFPITWCSPDPRGILFLSKVHYGRSLLKLIRKKHYRITMNQRFSEVINWCAQTRKDNTWITSEIIDGYIELFKCGKAYSVECWNGEDLVGGLYGVCLKKFYSAESMFNLENNTGKLCFYFLLEKLKKEKVPWVDIQMVTPLSENFGGEEITRSQFLKLLEKSFNS